MNERIRHQLNNLKSAFAKLVEFAQTANQTEVVRAGVIQAFEFTFELYWKVYQSLAVDQGLPAASPKAALKAAFKLGLIDDEAVWLDMLTDRNLTVQTYKEALAKEIHGRIVDRYIAAMATAVTVIETQVQ